MIENLKREEVRSSKNRKSRSDIILRRKGDVENEKCEKKQFSNSS